MNDFFIFVSAFVSIVVLITLGNIGRQVQAVNDKVDAMAKAMEAATKGFEKLDATPELLKKMAGVLAAQNFQIESLDRRLGGGAPPAKKQPAETQGS